MWIYIVTGESESGDKYGPLAFSKRPNKAKLSAIANGWDGGDGEGSGEGGSYVNVEVHGVLLNAGETDERAGLG